MVTTQSAQEQRLILHNIGWDTYERLLRDHANASSPRFAYDRGTLEIMSPLPEHERLNRAIQLLVPVIAEEIGVDLDSLGSTTFNREDLQRGFEPDSCFYVQNAARVHGRSRIDLQVDPAPDIVVEIDITHPSLDKLPIYAQIGVPEVWRYVGARLEILVLAGDHYEPSSYSTAFPSVTATALTTLLPVSLELGNVAWIRRARAWMRELANDASRPGSAATTAETTAEQG
jgi:Uma2 family endonuclease